MIRSYNILFIAFLMLSASMNGLCQFTGGNGDGFGSKQSLSSSVQLVSFHGGNGDGNAVKQDLNAYLSVSFLGGVGDGADVRQNLDAAQGYAFLGGTGDGADVKQNLDASQSYAFLGGSGDGVDVRSSASSYLYATFTGGIGDGSDRRSYNEDRNLGTFEGGIGDGSDQRSFNTKVWEGTVNSEWSHPDNWSDSAVPTAGDNAWIPNGKPNYPFILNETLEIGTNGAMADHIAKSLRIAGSATVEGSGEFLLRNAGFIELRGTLDIISTLRPAMINDAGAIIRIGSEGLLSVTKE